MHEIKPERKSRQREKFFRGIFTMKTKVTYGFLRHLGRSNDIENLYIHTVHGYHPVMEISTRTYAGASSETVNVTYAIELGTSLIQCGKRIMMPRNTPMILLCLTSFALRTSK